MRAFQLKAFGSTPGLVQCDTPQPGREEVLLKVAACGLNFADLLMIEGKYQDTPEPPFTLGLEMAGEVVGLGAGADPALMGQRVAVYAGQGGLADYAAVPAARCVPVPDGLGLVEAAGFQIAYGTSHLALDHAARLQPGETLVVTGAAGGVGLTAVEIGHAMGARVIAVARGIEKLAAARRAGADELVDSEEGDLRDRLRALGGADVVYDTIGGEVFDACFRATRPGGRVLLIGFASGKLPELRPNHMLVKNISVIGLYWGGYLKFAPRVLTDSLDQLFQWAGEGLLQPHVSHVLPLEQAAEALALLRSRTSTGKVVVTTG